jgi:hypothetical protein
LYVIRTVYQPNLAYSYAGYRKAASILDRMTRARQRGGSAPWPAVRTIGVFVYVARMTMLT